MAVTLIYDSTDGIHFADSSHYFSDFCQVLFVIECPQVLIGAFLQVTVILELLIADTWQGFEIFQSKYPIVYVKQNIWFDRFPRTKSPDSRNKLLVKLSEPNVSSVKVYVF